MPVENGVYYIGQKIEGVTLRSNQGFADDRQIFRETYRADWAGSTPIKQVSACRTDAGVIKAWHQHVLQTDYFFVVTGSLLVVLFDPQTGNWMKIACREFGTPTIQIPSGIAHGYRVLGHEPATLIYAANELYNYTKPDEMRIPWNQYPPDESTFWEIENR